MAMLMTRLRRALHGLSLCHFRPFKTPLRCTSILSRPLSGDIAHKLVGLFELALLKDT